MCLKDSNGYSQLDETFLHKFDWHLLVMHSLFPGMNQAAI
jgi:hypothetical protein